MFRGAEHLSSFKAAMIFMAAFLCFEDAFAVQVSQASFRSMEKEKKVYERKQQGKILDPNSHVKEADRSIPVSQKKYGFTLKKFSISGNKNLTDSQLAKYIIPHIGKRYTKEIQLKILKDISKAYDEIDLIYSFVQEIETNGKSIKIKIIEGHLNKIIYDKRFDKDPLFKFYIDKLKELKPFNKKKARYYLELLKKRPGIVGSLNISQRLLPGISKLDPENPAAVNMVIGNLYYRVDGSLGIDNRYKGKSSINTFQNDNPNVKLPESNYARIINNFNNYFGKGEKITVSGMTTGDSDDQGYGVAVKYPLGLGGASIFSELGYNDSQKYDKQKILFMTLGYQHPLYVDYQNTLMGSVAINRYNETQNEIKITDAEDGDPNKTIRNKEKRTINTSKIILGLNYKYKQNIFDLGYHQSLTAPKKHVAVSDFGHGRFNKFTLTSSVNYKLFDYIDFNYYVDAQYSDNDLLFSEVFSAGLYKGGRGYVSGEIFGDSGISNSFELSKTFDTDDHPYFVSHREYVYIDDSRVQSNYQDETKARSGNILSAGIGTEITVVDNIIFNFEYSKPLKEKIDGIYLENRAKRPKSRVYIGMDYLYSF